MKKIRENTLWTIKIASISALSLFCLTQTEAVREAVYDAVTRCLTVIIPSLYAMMIVSGILVRSGLTAKIACIFSKVGHFLFGMSGSVFPIFLMSMFAGYPIGTTMLCGEAKNGSITRREAEIFAGVCYGAGPAFIFGCISSRLYGSPSAGRIILISVISANILLAFLMSFAMRGNSSEHKPQRQINLSADALTESVLSAGRSMANICFMITAFAVLTAFLSETGIITRISSAFSSVSGVSAETTEGIICAFLDVTNTGGLPYGNYNLLPVLSALTSFGGICVIMQISVLTAGKIGIKPLIILRTAAAILSGIICRIIMPYQLEGEIVSAAKMNFSTHNADSPIPSFLLIIMTIILFGEYEKLSGRNNS